MKEVYPTYQILKHDGLFYALKRMHPLAGALKAVFSLGTWVLLKKLQQVKIGLPFDYYILSKERSMEYYETAFNTYDEAYALIQSDAYWNQKTVRDGQLKPQPELYEVYRKDLDL